MKSFETTNSVFNITDENKSFLITTRNYWIPEGSEKIVDKLKEMLELRSQNDIELYVKEIEEKSNRKEKENSGFSLAGFDHLKNEMLAKLGE